MRNKHSPVLSVLLIIALGVTAYAGYQVYMDHEKYQDSSRKYQALAQEVVIDTHTDDEGVPKESGVEKSANPVNKRKPPIQVDFTKLGTLGNGLKGWLYLEALDISYPLMQSTDNDYYLHRTVNGDYDFAGSIFMDAENNPDFTDSNTIIYGHNMADGSMFGTLKNYSLNAANQSSPYIWILTEKQDYCYEIFSAQTANTSSECYTLFSETDQSFISFLERMRRNSGIETGSFTFTEKDKILTLSTCNGDGTDTNRYVVQALRRE